MQVYCDLHIHGKYSGGTSKNMSFELLDKYAQIKGLKVLGTGDILHPKWRKEFEEYNGETLFILQTEIEDKNRVHHVLLFEDLDMVKNIESELKKYGNLEIDGRPKLKIDGKTIAKICVENDVLFGPAHAFTPYFGVYAHFDKLVECYGEFWEEISFLELGLSADSYMADLISDNHKFPFLSNSDCHTYLPHRLGRESQKIEVNKLTPKNVLESIKNNKIIFNIGLNPREGKYHMTACNRCYKKYSLEMAESLNWKCPCGGNIKRGVRDRILMLKDCEGNKNRVPYYYNVPLMELIEIVLGYKIGTKQNEEYYNKILEGETELYFLFEKPIDEIPEPVRMPIKFMRENKIVYIPGGGGQYGKPIIPKSEEEYKRLSEIYSYENILKETKIQKTLF